MDAIIAFLLTLPGYPLEIQVLGGLVLVVVLGLVWSALIARRVARLNRELKAMRIALRRLETAENGRRLQEIAARFDDREDSAGRPPANLLDMRPAAE